jgi:hypothetical protein
MLRIVLPVAIAAADVGPVASSVDILVVVVVHEIIVVVDVDIVVAAPSATPTPASAPGCSHHHADAEGNRHSRCVIACRWVVDRGVWVNGWTVDIHWVVAGNIDDLRIGLLNHDDGLILHNLGFYFLLLGGFQVPFFLGFLAHALDRIHDITLLREESIA